MHVGAVVNGDHIPSIEESRRTRGESVEAAVHQHLDAHAPDSRSLSWSLGASTDDRHVAIGLPALATHGALDCLCAASARQSRLSRSERSGESASMALKPAVDERHLALVELLVHLGDRDGIVETPFGHAPGRCGVTSAASGRRRSRRRSRRRASRRSSRRSSRLLCRLPNRLPRHIRGCLLECLDGSATAE